MRRHLGPFGAAHSLRGACHCGGQRHSRKLLSARTAPCRYREFVLGVWSLLSLDREDLAGFSFFLYDHDYNGHLELSELMNILNDVHGEGTANPNGRSAKSPHYTRAVQHFQMFSKKKHGSTRHLDAEGKTKESYVTHGEFCTFSKNTPSLLWPAFRLQTDVRAHAGNSS